jgi:cell division protein ZapA (FtsZ GTPase activity inhibitor)
MNTTAKKYKVTIFDESYTLVSDESEKHIVDSALQVDKLMSDIARQAGVTDVKKLAVLVALQFSSELKHLKENLEMHNLEKDRLATLVDQGLSDLQR